MNHDSSTIVDWCIVMLDIYDRKREAELLDALEGVVKRCHELEAQLC